MDPNLSVEGHWMVDGKCFYKKFDALIYATEIKKPVEFVFFTEVWNKFDRSVLGKFSLNDLYKKRAQQIRDEYDYLILYFSGGADSYNVMRTFLDNGIRLDEVCVKWPMAAVRAQVYTPNPYDLEPTNTLSEWDYAIKPVLEWLAQKYPEVKITVVDWTENLDESMYNIELFQKVNNFNDIEIPFMTAYSPSERFYIEKGKTVGSIYGIEKPKVGFHEGKWYMWFLDNATGMGVPSDINPFGTEYFYWSPKFPILAFEQAYAVCCHLDKNLHLKHYFKLSEKENMDIPTKTLYKRYHNSICKDILYDNWNGNFQPFKPDIPDRADKHFWIFQHPELTRIRDTYIDINSLLLNQVHSRFNLEVLDNPFGKKRGIFKGKKTKFHFVKFENES